MKFVSSAPRHREFAFRQIATLSLTTILLFFAATLSGIEISAQITEGCIGGRSYIVAFPDTVENSQDSRYLPKYEEKTLLFIYSPVNQQVRISRPEGPVQSVAVAKGEIVVYDTKDLAAPVITTPYTPDGRTLLVESDYSIVVYAYMSSHFGAAAFTPLPVEGWGTEYFAAAWPGDYVRDIVPAGETAYDASMKVAAPAEVLVIAAYDNTVVTIDPTGDLSCTPSCDAAVVLNRGEAYLIQSSVDTNAQVMVQADISGTHIRSNKPVGVISGNTRTQIEKFSIRGLGENSPKDLAIAWISPVSRHGTEFVYTPTWDTNRVGSKTIDTSETRDAEFVRLFGTAPESTSFLYTPAQQGDSVQSAYNDVPVGKFGQLRFSQTSVARRFVSSKPAMAFQSPKSVLKYHGTTGSGTFIGAAYKAWGTYLVEMVPREHWQRIAPLRIPSTPTGIRGYVNVVTEAASTMDIYLKVGGTVPTLAPLDWQMIEGTDLAWGTMPLSAGVSYVLMGVNGAMFSGHVYGTWNGFELHRPGGNRDGEEKGDRIASLHPSEYEEATSQMFAYPFPSFACIGLLGDSVDFALTQGECGETTIEVMTTNPSSSGLDSIRLDAEMSTNTELVYITPNSGSQIKGAKSAVVGLRPRNPAVAAFSVLEVRDQSDSIPDRIPYRYEPEYLVPYRTVVDFGTVDPFVGPVEKRVVFLNPFSYPVDLRGINFGSDTSNFTLVRTEPAIDLQKDDSLAVIPAGDSLVLVMRLTTDESLKYSQTISLQFDCLEPAAVKLEGSLGLPCLTFPDLNFGNVNAGDKVYREMEICNIGTGTIVLKDLEGSGAILSWGEPVFTITGFDMSRLRDAILAPGECITVSIHLTTDQTGSFETTATLSDSTRGCNPISHWQANVVDSGASSVEREKNLSGLQVTPNPTDGLLRIQFNAVAGQHISLTLIDAAGREVARIAETETSAGLEQILWNADALPAGLYFVRLQIGEDESVERVYLVK